MECKAHILRDLPEALTLRHWAGMSFRQLQGDPGYAHGLGAFTTVRYHADDYLYLGTTAFDNDLLYRFDRKARKFICLNYAEQAERFEVKIHRSLEIDTDGTIYGATAGQHRPDDRADAPGGSLFVFDPKTDAITKLGIPVAWDYIQNITLDTERRKICGGTHPVSKFFCYDLEEGRTVREHYIGSMPHRLGQDDHGRVWGTWGKARKEDFLLAYDLDADRLHFSRVKLPGLERTDAGALDGIVNGGDGYMYIGTTQGALVRLDPSDPDSPQVTFLGKPLPKWRIPALVCGEDGLIYMAAGGEYDVHILTYDRTSGLFNDLGHIVDKDTGVPCFMPHDLALAPDGLAYVGETDHPERASYLWECAL